MADVLHSQKNWPPFAPVPPRPIRQNLPPAEWEICLDSWIILAQLRLQKWQALSSKSEFVSEDPSLVSFIISFYDAISHAPSNDRLRGLGKVANLKKLCFALTRGLLSGQRPPDDLLTWAFLSNLASTFGQSVSLTNLLLEVWKRKQNQLISSIEKAKIRLVKDLSSNKADNADSLVLRLNQLTRLALALPDTGHVLMTGSDYLDSLCSAYQLRSEELRRALVANAYVSLTSLTKTSSPNVSLLLDHLFSMKSSVDRDNKSLSSEPSLLSDLVGNTSFLDQLSIALQGSNQKRGTIFLEQLQLHKAQHQSHSFHHRSRRKTRISKGKSRVVDGELQTTIHVHKLSLITQLQDIFPDLGGGYILHLLDHYFDDTEAITAALLEDTLPPELQHLDRTEPLPGHPTLQHDLSPRTTPPLRSSILPERKNIFDNDEFDTLSIAASKLHIGRANTEQTADSLLSGPTSSQAKAAILSALAAFDSDDDERDDTYDVADVGGTVDSQAQNSDTELDRDPHGLARAVMIVGGRSNDVDAASTDGILFAAYTTNPAVFARDAQTRRGKARQALRAQLSSVSTGPSMTTDEAIEGWAVMLQRDPKRAARLESRYGATGAMGSQLRQQQVGTLPPTSYRRPPATDSTEDEGTDTGEANTSTSGGRGRGRGAGRGRGSGGRGKGRGGGNAAAGGPAGEAATAAARQRKTQRGSGHNRREGRAKKVARAGYTG